jgi:cellulose synthase/poly-beta-1,6-N-acetylglucosamine synthase-like glycosyltransferase
MVVVSWVLILSAAGIVAYTYAGYPLILWTWSRARPGHRAPRDPERWPTVSITVPAYNEAAQIRDTVESLLRIDYPPDRRQVLIVSDASDDGTDDIVRGYADRGVELLRMPERVGKTAAENAARLHLTGDIIINTDASIRIEPPAVKALVREFADPAVGVASGRDVSTSGSGPAANSAESGYVGYEMWVRHLETRVGSIVGASGSLYAIRRELHQRTVLPPGLSRDFSAALVAREHGYRAVSVDHALCLVPRTASLRAEYRRKVRTMVRGMQTLFFKRHLLDPLRHGRFAWMLFSHKVCRWLAPWALLMGLAGLILLGLTWRPALLLLAPLLALLVLAAAGWAWPERRTMPRALSMPAFAFAGNLAAMVAAARAARGELGAVWEPTRRDPGPTGRTEPASPAAEEPRG